MKIASENCTETINKQVKKKKVKGNDIFWDWKLFIVHVLECLAVFFSKLIFYIRRQDQWW